MWADLLWLNTLVKYRNTEIQRQKERNTVDRIEETKRGTTRGRICFGVSAGRARTTGAEHNVQSKPDTIEENMHSICKIHSIRAAEVVAALQPGCEEMERE